MFKLVKGFNIEIIDISFLTLPWPSGQPLIYQTYMKIEEIENIELKFLDLDDYQELKTAMISAYTNMPGCILERGAYSFFN